MSQQIIKSRTNPLVQKVRAVRDGKDKSLIFCEGIKLVTELLSSPYKAVEIFSIPKLNDTLRKALVDSGQVHVPLILVDETVMDALTDLESAAGVVALAKREEAREWEAVKGDLFLFLPRTQLPQNLGAIVRSAEATGVQEIWIGNGSADPFSPKCIRGSTGSVFRVPIRRGVEFAKGLAQFKENDIQVVAATQNGKLSYDLVDWTLPTALVLGAEGSGFTDEQIAQFDKTIKIPMEGQVESLNLATAAAICLFEGKRQRRMKKGK